MILLDTSALVACVASPHPAAKHLEHLLARGERLVLPAIALYEWLRGPRSDAELEDQEALFPRASAIPFGPEEAARAAALFRRLPRSRPRAADLAIAATALVHDAALWTLNPRDFADIPGLRLARLP